MYVLGIDVGTTGTKSALVRGDGTVAATAYREYSLAGGDGGRVSQNAADWWDAVVSTVRGAAKGHASEVSALSLSTQGASMLAADGNGNPLSEVITWMDSRSSKETEYLENAVGAEKIYKKCGWPLTPAGDAAKIIWLKNNMPEVFEGAACFPSTVGFINFKLVGRFVEDPTNSAIRQLFNIERGEWDEEILSAVGTDKSRLPEVVPTGAFVGRLAKGAADELGLREDVKVYCGAHDQYAASLGAGAITPGDMMLATGTAWVVLGVTERPLYTESGICPGVHPAGGYGAMASLVSAGSALKWFRDLVGEDYRSLDEGAATRRESAKDVVALPYVAGAGFPHNLPDASCVLSGLRIGHDRYDAARAVMEGVAFETRSVLEKFSDEGMAIGRLVMTGGAAKSDLWASIVRDVTGCEVVRPGESECCCLGAAKIALVGEGVYPSYAAFPSLGVKCEKPDADAAEFYEKKYSTYREVRRKVYGV